ncbi:Peroxisomal 2,4-dienoyl-CoA reductase [Vitis vinifera]|uniref:2,4-dienoyl-CoA reductase [(3E)-enoyl-CoA-producing] n=1 Tax=Vitis vinifera TaxID=29760 RepID=A0A438CQY2_VITVI|nr:Peroxisomal 2,4-dienoyl-CoA reductase [Vitis vinifera]
MGCRPDRIAVVKHPEKVRYRPDRIAAVRHPKRVGCRPDSIAAVRHSERVGCRPDSIAAVRHPEKVRYRPNKIVVVRHPERVGCRPDRIAAVRHPEKVRCWPDRIAIVRHPGGIGENFRPGGMSNAVGFVGDVRKQEDAKRVVESTVKHFGRLDILVNAAAGNFLVSSEDLSPNGFRTVMDIDSVGTFTMCHEALKYLKKGGPGRSFSSGGSILNISATLHYTAAWYQIHVSAAKAAVDATTRNLALEWGTDYDIRVNGIAPGPIGDTAGMSKLAPEEISNKAREIMPLYKLGEKWDIAMAALYLASDAGKYINGTTLVVDGGLWLSRPRHLPKEAVKQLSRAVEKRSRGVPVGVPKSKL